MINIFVNTSQGGVQFPTGGDFYNKISPRAQ